MLDFLTERIKNALSHLNKNKLCEIRIRENSPVTVNYGGEYFYLRDTGITLSDDKAIALNREEISKIVYLACERSVYSVNEEIKQGFISVNGVRIGVCGTYVLEGDKVVSLRDYSSLCIRIPHEVKNCSQIIRRYCEIASSSILIISPPGYGKTTALKDLAYFLSLDKNKNVLLCDERGELKSASLNLDVISFANKKIAFEYAVRAMRPDVIITDELILEDYKEVEKTVLSGVKVIASAHGDGVREYMRGAFDYFVVLSSKEIGKVERIYSASLEEIYA